MPKIRIPQTVVFTIGAISLGVLGGVAAIACTGSDDAAPASTTSETTSLATTSMMDDPVGILHHWQALGAIQAGDMEEAIHHVTHIIDAAQGSHREAMIEAADLIRAGVVHEAEHLLEGMLAGEADAGLRDDSMHALMALEAIGLEDVDEAQHHVAHLVAATNDQEMGTKISAAFARGDLQEAEGDLKVIAAGLTGSDDADAQAEHHDDEDAEHHDDEEGEVHNTHEGDTDHDAAELDADGARVINVVMEDFAFGPREIHVKVGETVRLVLQNEGTVLHDFTVTEFAGEAQAVTTTEHADSTAHAHGDAPGLHAAAVAAGEAIIIFTATEVGTYDVFCSVPGHSQLGMTAVLIVEA